MNKKIVFSLQHACTYTQEGIYFFLKNISFDLGLDSTCILHRPKSGSCDALRNDNVSIFILGLEGYGDNHVGALDFIIKWLPIYHPKAGVVIMANTHSIGKLKDYLLGLKNVYAVLDNAITLQDFRMHLKRVIADSQGTPPKKRTTVPLTYQELNVLNHLLKGMPVLEVANELRIHYKTVSSHKISALNKMGINSLHGLMKCGNNTKIMIELLRSKFY